MSHRQARLMNVKIRRDANSLMLGCRYREGQSSARSVFVDASEECASAPSVLMSVTLRASTNVFLECPILKHTSTLSRVQVLTENLFKIIVACEPGNYRNRYGASIVVSPCMVLLECSLQSFESERPRYDTTTFITMSSCKEHVEI